MSSKKRRGEDDEERVSKSSKSDLLFQDLKCHLHPAALSKTRRTIFEKQIGQNGGKLVDKLPAETTGDILVLVEDGLIQPDKLDSVIGNLVKANQGLGKHLVIVGFSWLSKCLAEMTYFDYSEHRLNKVQISNKKDSVEYGISKTKPENSKPQDSSYIERNKHKFVCAQSSDNPSASNLNQHITDQLEKLATAYKSSNDTWRAFGYQKTIAALKNYPKAITSREEASKIPNVGKKMADKIMEIIEEGSLRKVQEVCDNDRMKIIDLFNRVWGAGPTTAEKWYRQGLKTLDDLKEKGQLTKQQEIGLKHFYDLDERMQREECTKIYEVVKKQALEIQEGLEVIACGSYRRGKSTCGDLDILITHSDPSALEGIFHNLLSALRKTGFLTDDLSVHKDGRQQKYLGVCRLPGEDSKHRRLDIIVVPFEERACALMYFTGSAHFNRSMRLLATKMGMSLSEHSLVKNVVRFQKEKLNEGSVIPTPTEESVFEHLGLPYRSPSERNH